MLKILHTADWHIGKKFQSHHSLMPELRQFFDWLEAQITAHSINVLLVTGDIFDSASPSPESRQLYYQLLTRLVGRKIQVIILGGNHDLPMVLDAPRDLLAQLDITVMGKITEKMDDQLLVLPNSERPELVVGAVPFLRDADIRRAAEFQTYSDRVARTREGILQHYKNLTDLAKQKYPNLPFVMTGHLFATGGQISQSEREIQVGNLADIDFSPFEHQFDYLALGHLHRPQKVGKIAHFRYAGSPIVLGIDEIEHKKQVNILSFDNKKLQHIESVEVPKFRIWEWLKGSIDDVEKALNTLNESTKTGDLSPYVYFTIQLKNGETKPLDRIRDWQQGIFDKITIVGYDFEGQKSAKNLSDTGGGASWTSQSEDLTFSPIKVLRKRMDEMAIEDSAKRAEIEDAFDQILNKIQEEID